MNTNMNEEFVQHEEPFQVGSSVNNRRRISSNKVATQYNVNENNVTQTDGLNHGVGFHFRLNLSSKPIAILPKVQLTPNIPSKPVTIRQNPYLQSKPKSYSMEDRICKELGIKFIPNIPIKPYTLHQDFKGMRQPFNVIEERSKILDRFKENVTPKPPVIKQASSSNYRKYLPSGSVATKIGCSVGSRVPFAPIQANLTNEILPNALKYCAKPVEFITVANGASTSGILMNQNTPVPIKDKRGRLKKYSKSVMNNFKVKYKYFIRCS